MGTIRFYRNRLKNMVYMGWEKLRPEKVLCYANWVRSGNTLVVGERVLSTEKEVMMCDYFEEA